MTTIYLSLGSNLGNRAENVARAVAALKSHGVRVIKQSSLYETEPADVPADLKDQGWFLNSVVEAETDLPATQLMSELLGIEQALGRQRRIPKGPRLIDIDILLYGSQMIDTPEVRIPHPRMTERRFVLAPFVEIAPQVQHPVLRKTIAELLDVLSDRSEVRRFVS